MIDKRLIAQHDKMCPVCKQLTIIRQETVMKTIYSYKCEDITCSWSNQ